MTTTEKLLVVKEILASSFLLATEHSVQQGLQFTYKTYNSDVKDNNGEIVRKEWYFDFIVRELGRGEHVIQQLRFNRPNNIDAKNMEYHVCIEAIASLTQSSLITWYEVGKMLAQEKELQKTIIDETKKDNIASF